MFLFALNCDFLGSESPLKKGVKFGHKVGLTEPSFPSQDNLQQLTEGAAIRAHQTRLQTTPRHTRLQRGATHTPQPVTSQHAGVQRGDIKPPGARPSDNGLGKSDSPLHL